MIERVPPSDPADRSGRSGRRRCSWSTDLRTYFDLRHGVVKAVDGVSFSLAPHETLAIVGESGCGKSITALSLMRLVPDPPGRIAGGSVKLAGVDLLALDEEAMRACAAKTSR